MSFDALYVQVRRVCVPFPFSNCDGPGEGKDRACKAEPIWRLCGEFQDGASAMVLLLMGAQG